MASGKSSKESKPKKAAQGPGELPRGKLALIRDPRVYEQRLPPLFPPHKRILGLDIASHCGATFCDVIPGQPISNATLIGGQWNLSIGPHDTQSIRYLRLKTFLTITSPDLVFFEEVKYVGQNPAPGMAQNLTALVARAVSGAQVVQGLCAILQLWAEERGIPCQAIPVGVLKKYATGSGAAKKEDMIAACNKRFNTEFEVEGYESTGVDNIADSMFLCAMAVQNYSEGL